MDVKEAVDIVNVLLHANDGEESLTGIPALASSTLSTIIQLASHVQELSENYPEMDSVTLGIYGIIPRRESGSGNRLMTLFGPRIEADEDDLGDITERRTGNVVNAPSRARRELTTGGDGAVSRGANSSHARAVTIERRGEREAEERMLQRNEAPGVNVGECLEARSLQPGNVRECYQIPDEIAVKCMSYFLDSSGCTSHPKSYKARDLEGVNARVVTKVVKALFKSHKTKICTRGVNSHGVRYKSLVADQMKGKEVMLPRICVSRSRTGCGYIREGVVKTNLSIAKADRNTKVQNIALIASLLHYQGHGVNVEDILTEFGLRGLGQEGCKLFGGCRVGRPCKDAPKEVCLLYGEVEGERKVVGKGSPDPFVTFTLGKEVPRSSIAVRVNTVTCSTGMEFIRREGCAVDDNLYLWPKPDIGRVEFLGEFGEVLGTSIFVCKLFPDGDGGGGANSARQNNTMNISDAVLLCDVRLVDGKESESYPFQEWYSNSYTRRIRELQYETPKELRDVLCQSGEAMLWWLGRIREMRDT